MLMLLGSTYVCEQTVSLMNTDKVPHRSLLNDEHLRFVFHYKMDNRG